VIEPTTNLLCQSLQHGKIEDQPILSQRALNLNQYLVIVPMKVLTFATIGNEVGRTEIEIVPLHLHFTHDLLTRHNKTPCCSTPKSFSPFRIPSAAARNKRKNLHRFAPKYEAAAYS
jgi:hypothetical protein